MQTQVFSFTGAGGKTSLLLAMADFFLSQNKRVCISTTTKIYPPEKGCLFLREVQSHTQFLQNALASQHTLCVFASSYTENKLCGFSIEEMDAIIRTMPPVIWLIEADGAAGKPLKAHAEHEPCIPASSTGVFALLGADAFFLPLSQTCHRPELALDILQNAGIQASLSAPLSPAGIAHLLIHPSSHHCRHNEQSGAFKHAPPHACRNLFLNKTDLAPPHFFTHTLPDFAKALHRLDSKCQLFAGSIKEKTFSPFPTP